MPSKQTGERNEAAKRLVTAKGRGARGYAIHKALRARATPGLAGKHVWIEAVDTIVALQTASCTYTNVVLPSQTNGQVFPCCQAIAVLQQELSQHR